MSAMRIRNVNDTSIEVQGPTAGFVKGQIVTVTALVPFSAKVDDVKAGKVKMRLKPVTGKFNITVSVS